MKKLTYRELSLIWDALYGRRSSLYHGNSDELTKAKINEYNKLISEIDILLKKQILAIYYNPKFIDCYTIYFDQIESYELNRKQYLCLTISDNPDSVCMHGSGMLGRHNGKKISFEELPKEHQKIVERDLLL